MANGRLIGSILSGAMIGAVATAALSQQSVAPKAYVVAEIEVHDAAGFARDYAPKVPAILASFGGRYLARGGRTVPLEGRKPGGRIVVIEFPSLAAAQNFEASPAYQAVAPARHRAADTNAFIVEGVEAVK